MKTLPIPEQGFFVSPTVIKLDGIHELEDEIFGPVLHIATFKANAMDQVINQINARGFGLTFGLHTHMDTQIARIVKRVKMGNIYINRNQIGAIVGSQPFGGEGLSGTGPKAGGPHYVRRFMKSENISGVWFSVWGRIWSPPLSRGESHCRKAMRSSLLRPAQQRALPP